MKIAINNCYGGFLIVLIGKLTITTVWNQSERYVRVATFLRYHFQNSVQRYAYI